MDSNVKSTFLTPGLLVKKDPEEFDLFLVVKNKGQILLKDVHTGEEMYPEDISYMIVGRNRSENILVSIIHWGCREDFPMEDLKELLQKRSDCRLKTYVSFPNDGSDSFLGIFTSTPVSDDEAYYVYLKSADRLFGG
jgi:hypothetical protein